MKKLLFTTLLTAPFLLCFSMLLFSSSTNLVHLLDVIFLIGLFFLVIGSVMLVLQAGFFNAFISTSKHFFSTINKREQSIRQFEGKNSKKTAYKKEYPSLKKILLLGAVYFSFSLIASITVVFLGY
ncbi:DUF3899 domain-containing protein [Sporosarcina sp. ACRSL]|uniref:DUF3899 domain-containing protein n=1 Tax=Sporosarcina sp. ACRSL TaxID=2918215 RepID=UPI001EF5A24B|nr:DUF3899 domain-containing protein [Sporosarcina sp. ACRSL]MCG7344032.1 DUF3899 domain-containing protein [Sporosarcina sp. ACRSL]